MKKIIILTLGLCITTTNYTSDSSSNALRGIAKGVIGVTLMNGSTEIFKFFKDCPQETPFRYLKNPRTVRMGSLGFGTILSSFIAYGGLYLIRQSFDDLKVT